MKDRIRNVFLSSALAALSLLLTGANYQPRSIVATSTLSSSVTSSVVSKPATTPIVLSPYEEEVARIVKFDHQVMLIVKEEVRDRIGRLIGFDKDGYQIVVSGIVMSVPEDKVDSVLASLRHRLLPLQYLPFVVEINSGSKIEKLGVLKGTDQYEILRVMHTDGYDYDISNQDIIDRLKEWEYYSAFDIVGADNDWVELEFKILPLDLKSFAEEVYDFCPDAIDQGPGSVEGLIRDIKMTNRLFLWWD